jgi:hypothetical protein
MKKIIIIISSIFFSLNLVAQPSKLVKNQYGATQLQVNGIPFIVLAGELHNSSSSTVKYMNTIWPKIKKLNLNTVLAAVSWEQIEPQEGEFDFTLVDSLISGAYRNNLRLGILWFGSWKNGESSYAPIWVKHDTKRFFRVLDESGRKNETLSPFCMETCKSDANAFARLMAHIRNVDHDNHTVILIQVENEVGVFLDMDYSKIAQKTYEKKWKLRYGDSKDTKSKMMAWQYAAYINKVAEAGKKEYNLPMYCNCWLVQKPEDVPGVYPNGGPVTRVFDIWKKVAPSIDFLSPDIYLPDFRGIVADYHRKNNPLFIPEAMMKLENAFYAIGEHDALGYSPFGIEDGIDNYSYSEGYKTLSDMMPLITKYQGSKRLSAFYRYGAERDTTIEMDNHKINVIYENHQAFGIIIQTGEHEFYFAGMGFKASFSNSNDVYIEQIYEGEMNKGNFCATRLLNGDETYHNLCLVAKGKQTFTSEKINSYEAKPSENIFVYSPETYKSVWSPAIYKVITYNR